MEKVSDFLKSIQERIVSPLFSSLCISWLVVNWKVTVGLLFYTNDELKCNNHSDKIGLVKDANNFLPIWLAVGFVFLYPILKNFIKAWIAFMNSKGDTWGLNWSKEKGKISLHKYYQMKKAVEYQMDAAEKLMADENKYQSENLEYKKEVADLNQKISSANNLAIKILNLNDSSIMNGIWTVRVGNENNINEMVYSIIGGTLNIETKGLEKNSLGRITDFAYNPKTQTIIMIVSKQQSATNIFVLTFDEVDKTFSGTINKTLSVTMKKTTNLFD